MNVVYAFVGPLPAYCIDTIKQLRYFYNGPTYFIVSDYESPYISELINKYNVEVVRYDKVVDNQFNLMVQEAYRKFCIVHSLKGREKLFIHAFERFYILHNLMLQQTLQNVFFVELDNLLYNNPENWLESFSKKDMAYMFDNYRRASSGICYIKHAEILSEFLDYCSSFIKTSHEFMTEMTTLYDFWELNKDCVQMLPTHWEDKAQPTQTWETQGNYNNSIFDALSMGIYLGGVDPHHTRGVLTKGYKSTWGLIDYTKYMYEWKHDEEGRNIPYVWSGSTWLRINNLHIHSKDLVSCMSK